MVLFKKRLVRIIHSVPFRCFMSFFLVLVFYNTALPMTNAFNRSGPNNDNRPMPRLINQQNYQVFAKMFGNQLELFFVYRVSENPNEGTVKIDSFCKDFKYYGIYDNAYMAVKTEMIYYNSLARIKLGYDQRETDLEQDKLLIRYFLNGKNIKTVLLKYNNNTIDTENVLIYLQNRLKGGTNGFDKDLILKSSGMQVNVHFDLVNNPVEITNLIVNNNITNSLMKDVMDKPGDYCYYQMILNGVFRYLANSKFVFLYNNKPPNRLVAYWGGGGNSAEQYLFQSLDDQ